MTIRSFGSNSLPPAIVATHMYRMRTPSRLLLAPMIALGLAGCVGNKRIVLLQEKETAQEQPVEHDHPSAAVPLLLQAGDILSVAIDHHQLTPTLVEGQPEDLEHIYRTVEHPYLIGFTISAQGEIDLPVIGRVKVAGMGLEGAQEAIRVLANNVYSDPSVKVFMLNFNVSVIGEVSRPGRYPVFNERMNVLEALSMAGDMTIYADRSNVRIVRTRDGHNRLYPIDLNDQQLLAGERFYLQPNDVVIVDPLKRRKYTGRDPNLVVNVLALLVSTLTLLVILNK